MGNKYESIETCSSCNDNDFIVIANGETGVESYCTGCGVFQWSHKIKQRKDNDGSRYHHNANKNSKTNM